MSVTKVAVACELLEESLRLYYQGEAYFAALHLAGTADELFAAYLKGHGQTSSFADWCTDGVRAINHLQPADPIASKDMALMLNNAKNRTKHMDSMSDSQITFDPRVEAHELLDRAVEDFYRLSSLIPLVETDLIKRFNRELLGLPKE